MKLARRWIGRLFLLWVVATSFFAGTEARAQTVAAGRGEEERALVERIARDDAEAAVLFEEATRHLDAGDFPRADEGFAAVLARRPGLAAALRRQASAKSEMGQRTAAIALARQALAAEASPESRSALAVVLLGQDLRAGSTLERKEALGLARDATDARPGDATLWLVRCEAAMANQSAAEVEACARSMERIAPDFPMTPVYGAVAAINQQEWSRAREAIEHARALGAPADVTDALAAVVEESRGPFDRWGVPVAYALAVWVAAILLLMVAGAILSHLTLRSVARMAGQRSADAGKTLRAIYRAILFASSVVYYVSLPIVLALVLAIGGGLIYGFFAIGHVPIKLVLIVGVLALVTVFAVIKSVLVRPRDDDPGERLDLDAHPRLRVVLEDVAAAVGTRPVDTVYVTPSTELAVFERGSLGKQLRGTTERCLVLGIGVLDGMRADAFRAVLAHEYGHFASRDTAGGGFALAVRRSLLLTAEGLARNGAATWYNPAWWFVRGFYAVFLRVSQGASRLQEYLADRTSAMTYGPEAFVEGLTHVIQRTVHWTEHVQASLDEVIQEKRPLANLYAYAPRTPIEPAAIERASSAALDRTPSPYDSHPCPKDRFAWVRSFAGLAPARAASDALAWDLVDDRAALERFMTDHVRKNVADNHGVLIPAEPEASS